jgi:hypothetical protein
VRKNELIAFEIVAYACTAAIQIFFLNSTESGKHKEHSNSK